MTKQPNNQNSDNFCLFTLCINGNCSMAGGSAVCGCELGFMGSDCSEGISSISGLSFCSSLIPLAFLPFFPVDPCYGLPCLNGNCANGTCNCSPGFLGNSCSEGFPILYFFYFFIIFVSVHYFLFFFLNLFPCLPKFFNSGYLL